MVGILLSIRPEWVTKILNGEKIIEIRKKFPADFAGWVYIYCTKGKSLSVNMKMFFEGKDCIRNGKVVARFWCDKVEEIKSQVVNCGNDCLHTTKTMKMTELLKASCLSLKELDSYLGANNGYAIHISKLEVFEKPRELSSFRKYCEYDITTPCDNEPIFPSTKCPNTMNFLYCNCKYKCGGNCGCVSLTKAPQNYCYIESEK